MIALDGVTKTFGMTPALQNFSASIARGEFVSIVGPSGCGKTTVLRLIAGLMAVDAGRILINGRPVNGPGHDRAMVFQQPTLLPWADVLSSVAFGLEIRGVPRAEREAVARDLIQTVGLEGFERHYPRQLSGGMQQRVGLARALAVNPDILLMDEPFASVDAQTRRGLQDELARIQSTTHKTIVFVTHDIDEAVRLGDRVLLMSPRPGRVRDAITVPKSRPSGEEVEADLFAIKSRLWTELREGA